MHSAVILGEVTEGHGAGGGKVAGATVGVKRPRQGRVDDMGERCVAW